MRSQARPSRYDTAALFRYLANYHRISLAEACKIGIGEEDVIGIWAKEDGRWRQFTKAEQTIKLKKYQRGKSACRSIITDFFGLNRWQYDKIRDSFEHAERKTWAGIYRANGDHTEGPEFVIVVELPDYRQEITTAVGLGAAALAGAGLLNRGVKGGKQEAPMSLLESVHKATGVDVVQPVGGYLAIQALKKFANQPNFYDSAINTVKGLLAPVAGGLMPAGAAPASPAPAAPATPLKPPPTPAPTPGTPAKEQTSSPSKSRSAKEDVVEAPVKVPDNVPAQAPAGVITSADNVSSAIKPPVAPSLPPVDASFVAQLQFGEMLEKSLIESGIASLKASLGTFAIMLLTANSREFYNELRSHQPDVGKLRDNVKDLLRANYLPEPENIDSLTAEELMVERLQVDLTLLTRLKEQSAPVSADQNHEFQSDNYNWLPTTRASTGSQANQNANAQFYVAGENFLNGFATKLIAPLS